MMKRMPGMPGRVADAAAPAAPGPGRPVGAEAGVEVGAGALCPGAWRSAVRTAVTEVTPGKSKTTFSDCRRSASISSAPPFSGSTSMAKPTLPSLMTRPETMPRATMLSPLSGSTTPASACRICSSLGGGILDTSELLPISPVRPKSRLALWRLRAITRGTRMIEPRRPICRYNDPKRFAKDFPGRSLETGRDLCLGKTKAEAVDRGAADPDPATATALGAAAVAVRAALGAAAPVAVASLRTSKTSSARVRIASSRCCPVGAGSGRPAF